MSMRTLESAILAGARVVLANPKLRPKDMEEWSSGPIDPHDGEVVAFVKDPGVWVAVKRECDKRKEK
jgi:hypothetical protein